MIDKEFFMQSTREFAEKYMRPAIRQMLDEEVEKFGVPKEVMEELGVSEITAEYVKKMITHRMEGLRQRRKHQLATRPGVLAEKNVPAVVTMARIDELKVLMEKLGLK